MKQPQKDAVTPKVPKSLPARHSPAMWEICVQDPATNLVESHTPEEWIHYSRLLVLRRLYIPQILSSATSSAKLQDKALQTAIRLTKRNTGLKVPWELFVKYSFSKADHFSSYKAQASLLAPKLQEVFAAEKHVFGDPTSAKWYLDAFKEIQRLPWRATVVVGWSHGFILTTHYKDS